MVWFKNVGQRNSRPRHVPFLLLLCHFSVFLVIRHCKYWLVKICKKWRSCAQSSNLNMKWSVGCPGHKIDKSNLHLVSEGCCDTVLHYEGPGITFTLISRPGEVKGRTYIIIGRYLVGRGDRSEICQCNRTPGLGAGAPGEIEDLLTRMDSDVSLSVGLHRRRSWWRSCRVGRRTHPRERSILFHQIPRGYLVLIVAGHQI